MNEAVIGAYHSLSEYFDLAKPRIALLVVFTTYTGMLVSSPNHIASDILFYTLLGTALASSASGLLNNYFDRDIDPLMRRTRNRALAAGRVSAHSVLILGLLCAVLGALMLVIFVNAFTAFLAMFTIFFYVVIYTCWLKRTTSWCTEVGGVAGAMPPLIGSAAVTGSLSATAILLFVVMFLWQPPHFWALALRRSEEYRIAGIPMLPVVHGELATRRRILMYTVALVPASLIICWYQSAHIVVYSLVALLNAVYLFKTVKFCREPIDGGKSMQLFGFSIFYLCAMFLLLFFML